LAERSQNIQQYQMAQIPFIDENGGGPGVRLRKRQQAIQTK
jgi:hypothetical protein